MANCFVMIGPAGCGKSTIAKQIAEKYLAEVYSSDSIREELYGDESVQKNPGLVFRTLYRRASDDLAIGCDVVIDATNLTVKNRKKIFKTFKRYEWVRFVAVPVEVPLEVCLKQNRERNRHVPEEVICRMYGQYQAPTIEEGFDEILHYVRKV